MNTSTRRKLVIAAKVHTNMYIFKIRRHPTQITKSGVMLRQKTGRGLEKYEKRGREAIVQFNQAFSANVGVSMRVSLCCSIFLFI